MFGTVPTFTLQHVCQYTGSNHLSQEVWLKVFSVLSGCMLTCAMQAEVEQQHKHIKSMIQQLQHQEQLMIADVRAAKVSSSDSIVYHCKVDTHINATLSSVMLSAHAQPAGRHT